MWKRFKELSFFRKLGLIILIFIILILMLGILMPKDIHVNVTETIKAPKNYSFNIVNDLRTQPLWNQWLIDDNDISLEFGNTVVGLGASYSWIGEKSGNGSMELTEVSTNEHIHSKLSFKKFSDGESDYSFKDLGNSESEMTWSFHSKISFPYNIVGFLFKYSIQRSFHRSMRNLSSLAEERYKNGLYYDYKIVEEFAPERYLLTMRSVIPKSAKSQFVNQTTSALFSKLMHSDQMNIQMPVTLIYDAFRDDDRIDLAVGIQVADFVNIPDVNSVLLPAGQVVTGTHTGTADDLELLHRAISAYMDDRGMFINRPVIEENLTDPGANTPAQNWQYKVTYYISNDKNNR